MNCRQKSTLLAALIVIGLFTVESVGANAAALIPLGYLPGGPNYSVAQAVSADGSTVVGYSGNPLFGTRAFRWTKSDGMIDLGSLSGDVSSWANAASADGTTIVGGTSIEGFRWTKESGLVGLG